MACRNETATFDIVAAPILLLVRPTFFAKLVGPIADVTVAHVTVAALECIAPGSRLAYAVRYSSVFPDPLRVLLPQSTLLNALETLGVASFKLDFRVCANVKTLPLATLLGLRRSERRGRNAGSATVF